MADTNMLYLVTRNNHLVRSDNILAATPTFTMMTTPAATNVTASITTDRFNPNVVYMSCNSTVYKSFNKGVTWVNITGALPAVNITKIIADRYSTNGRIFLAQATKVWYKDSTTPWTLITGLPTVARISDLMIYNDSTAASILRVSTYGRGIWEVNIHNDMMPIGDFVSNKQYVCVGDTVRYNKTAYGNIASFQWNFPGGTPATSTADSPVVVYSTAGVFTPSLILYGGGSVGNDTISKAGYIVVSNGVTAPIVEGFESTTFPPTPEWSQQSLSGKQWLHNDTVGAYGTSAKSMFFDNFHNNAFGKHDRITIPKIDLTSADTAYITFDIAYAYSPGYNDSLSIVVSTDCGKTFTSVVYTKTGATLASAPNLTTFFSPGNTSWRKDTVWLTPYLGQDIMAAFDNIGRNGQPIYVDNVNIYVKAAPSSVAAILPENGLLVYPNPASNELFVTAGVTINNVTVTNQIGQKVYSGTTNGKDISIDISSLPSGLYFVKVNNLYAAKFLKQ
jgi:PKD repeat protein